MICVQDVLERLKRVTASKQPLESRSKHHEHCRNLTTACQRTLGRFPRVLLNSFPRFWRVPQSVPISLPWLLKGCVSYSVRPTKHSILFNLSERELYFVHARLGFTSCEGSGWIAGFQRCETRSLEAVHGLSGRLQEIGRDQWTTDRVADRLSAYRFSSCCSSGWPANRSVTGHQSWPELSDKSGSGR